jgi:hypothetical protein
MGTAGAAALAIFIAGPAFAGESGFDNLLGVDYSHYSVNHGGNANEYGGDVSSMYGFGSFAVQGDGGYHHDDVSDGGGSSNDWDIDGTAFWRGGMGRVGAVVGYDSSDASHSSDDHDTSYGAFGEWYASRWLTAGIKGGAFNGSSDLKGDYLGAEGVGYITPNVSLTVGYDYTHADHAGNENDWSVKGEWLLSERMPIAVYGAYTNSKLGGGGSTVNVFTIGLTYFCGSSGPEPLVERQRTGAEEWGNTFSPAGLK